MNVRVGNDEETTAETKGVELLPRGGEKAGRDADCVRARAEPDGDPPQEVVSSSGTGSMLNVSTTDSSSHR